MTEEQYVKLIIKKLTSQANKNELETLELWKNEDPENLIKYDEIVKTWKNADLYQTNYKSDKNIAWKNIEENIQKKDKLISMNRFARIAAALAVIIGTSLAFYFILSNNSPIQFKNDELAVKEISLPDGTSVWLKKGTALSYIDENSTRLVHFKGEAFFDVVHNKKKPFVIKDENIKTTVLGTSFNLISRDSTSLTLVDGKVSFQEINRPSNSTIIDPGKTIVYSNNSTKVHATVNQNFDSWRTGIISFNNNDLNYVKTVLEHHYGETITLKTTSETKCLFTGEFDNETLDNIIEVMNYTYDMEYSKEQNNYTISISNCK